MSFAKYLVSCGYFKKEVPKIVDNDKNCDIWKKDGVWEIDNTNSRMSLICEEFCTWCAKKQKAIEFHFNDINILAKPNINGKLIYTVSITYECRVRILIWNKL